jgi:hypothetical protein
MIRGALLAVMLVLVSTQTTASILKFTFEGGFSWAYDPDGLISDEVDIASVSPFRFHWVLDLDSRGKALRNDGQYGTYIEYFGTDYMRESFFATLEESSLFLDVIDGGRFNEPYNIADYRAAVSWTDVNLLDGYDPSYTEFKAGSENHEFNISCSLSISSLALGSICDGIETTNAPLVGNHNPVARIYSKLVLTEYEALTVPEPPMIAVMGAGLVGLFFGRRRTNK